MATGDQSDLLGRLKTLLPRWFGDSSTLLTATLQGYASAGAFVYSLYAYAKKQTRISTATDGWLDMIAADFLGSSLIRKSGQSDDSFRRIILGNLLRDRATHDAMVKALRDLTGRTPRVVELRRPIDTTAYGVQQVQRAGPATYWGPDGTLRTAQPNVLRWTYDPANLGAAPTQLLEQAATQMLIYTDALDNPAGWSTYQATITKNAAIGPDGKLSAFRFANNGAVEQSLKAVPRAFVAGNNYAAFVLARAGEVAALQAVVSTEVANTGAGGNGVQFNLVTGRVDFQWGVCTGLMISLPNGWFLCIWFFTATVTGTIGGGYWLNLAMGPADTSKGLYLFGPQLTAGSTWSSYIQNPTGSPVTRPADILLPVQPQAGIGGYGVRGAYGSTWATNQPYQAFVTAYRPLAGSGYAATDAEIYATIDAVKPAATVIWTAISD